MMRLHRPVSPSTLVALAIAGVTAGAVITSLGNSTASVTTDTGTTGSVDAAEMVSGPARDTPGDWVSTDQHRHDLGAIEQAIPTSGAVAVRGSIGQTTDQPIAGAIANSRARVPGECPVMTDSIRRLYLGFLEREPSGDELSREIDLYRSGQANLEGLADALAGSGRFRTAYGPLSNEGFVERVYANTLGAEPTEAQLDHWVTNLANGYPRGAVMLAFTESAEFIWATDTTRPLSGYLAWYPEGTHWYCGVGPRDDLPVLPLTNDSVYADYLFINPGDEDVTIGLATVLDGRQWVAMVSAELPGGFTDYRWDGLFIGADDYGDAIDVVAGDETGWVVVFAPSSIGRQRLGWHVPS